MKKILGKKFNFLLLFLISSLFISTVFLSPNTFHNYSTTEDYMAPEDDLDPMLSLPDFVHTTKPPFVEGTQEATWNENNIRDDDGIYDGSNFVTGSSHSTAYYAASTMLQATGHWGTNNGGYWNHGDIDNALQSVDSNNVYLMATYAVPFDPDEFPAWIQMTWGYYPNPPAIQDKNVYRIRIVYNVWPDSFPGVLDQSSNLRLWIYDNVGNMQYITLDATSGHRQVYSSTWTLTSGTIFNRVKNNDGYIYKASVQMYAGEEWWLGGTRVWINVNYFRIYYDYYKYDIDFSYELEYDGLGLTTVNQFDYKIDLVDSVAGVYVYFYDFQTLTWVHKDTLSSNGAETRTGTISSNADHFFDINHNMKIRFAVYGLYNTLGPPQYHLYIDQIKIDIPLPDVPLQVEAKNGILHILLTWNASQDYGMPLTHYNVYRGDIQGGIKDLVGSPTTNEFNDTSLTVGTLYFYTVTAVCDIGESLNSSEVSGKAYDQPFVEWVSPLNGETIIIPYNVSDAPANWVRFNFSYNYDELDDIKLEIGGVDYGSVWNKTLIWFFPYLDGPRTLILHGFNQSVELANDSININFVRVIHEVRERLDFGTKILGQQLYLILHDPHGDHSFSSFTETTTLSIGVGHTITTAEAASIDVGVSFSLFGIDIGASTKLTRTETEEEGFDFRFEVSDITTLTSNQESDNPDYIGPGYGDVYWGEAWIFKWELNATRKIYSNDTNDVQYEKPKMYYGILRNAETVTNDQNAPTNWYNQNPIHNNWDGADWIYPYLSTPGGIPYTYTQIVTNTISRTSSFEVEIEESAAISLGIDWFSIGGSLTFTETVKNYVEAGLTHVIENSYTIHDDEPTDTIVNGRGIDTKFGTFIFNTSSFFCETSLPLEHNTYDYVPPILEFPDIDFDTDNDMIGPTSGDSPYVTVDIFEEGGIQDAIINYTINDGLFWDIVHLQEQSANPGTWAANIPSQPFNTTVRWYIMAWDDQGGKVIKTNATGYPFSYTVLPSPSEITGIPGYSIESFIPITLVSIVAITVIYYRKRKKLKK